MASASPLTGAEAEAGWWDGLTGGYCGPAILLGVVSAASEKELWGRGLWGRWMADSSERAGPWVWAWLPGAGGDLRAGR